MDSLVVEACPGLLVDHWRSYFSFRVLQLLKTETKITAEVSHLFHRHGMCNPIYDNKDICYVAIFQAFVSPQWSSVFESHWGLDYFNTLVNLCSWCVCVLPIYRKYFLNVFYMFRQSQIVLSYMVLIDAEARQSNITLYTSGLCGAMIGVSRHYHGSKRSISCTWWWSSHKKSDLSVFAMPKTNEVQHEVSPRRPVSFVSQLQVPHIFFPAPPHFTTVKVCIYQEEET